MENMVAIWLIICLAAFFLEWITAGNLICIWFSFGAIFALIAALLQWNLSIQITLFVVVAFATMVLLRPIAQNYLRGNTVRTNNDRVIGEICPVTKRITESSWGEVKVLGAYWSAVEEHGLDVEVDEKVKVLAIDGAKLIVKKL